MPKQASLRKDCTCTWYPGLPSCSPSRKTSQMKCCKHRQKPGNFPSMPNVKRSDAKTCQKHPKAPCRPTKLPSCGPSIYGHIGFREAFPWWWNEERGVAATARTGSQRNNRFQLGKLWSTHSLDMNCVSDSQPWQHQVRAPASQKKWPKKMCQAVPTLYTMHCSS